MNKNDNVSRYYAKGFSMNKLKTNKFREITTVKIFLLLLCLSCSAVFAQNITGVVVNSSNQQPIEFVNIGIVGKDIGTTTNLDGLFKLMVNPEFDNDSLLFSSIGYESQYVKISSLRNANDNKIRLKEKIYELSEVEVSPKKYKQKRLGIKTKSKMVLLGFTDNLLGYECGVLMKVKKSAILKQLDINIGACSYDSVFYRLNVYSVKGKLEFENILKEPIYIKLSKEDVVNNTIHVDLREKNIFLDGNFLVTLEHVKNLGKGYLYFCGSLGRKTFIRKTSQGKWDSTSIAGISISAIVDEEK